MKALSLRSALICFWTLSLGAGAARAHEVRPGYLEVREEKPGEFNVFWKTPMRGDLRLGLDVDLSLAPGEIQGLVRRRIGDASLETWRFTSREPLRGRTLRIQGLESTLTDVLARFQFADGAVWVARLTPSSPFARIPPAQTAWEGAAEYMRLGIEHILLGVDHLLFVLALLLATLGAAPLLKAVTAFTVAHSITLGLAALGIVHVPAAPTEALIALSIALVAAEAVRARTAESGGPERRVWILPFAFGLLHGLGFAGALSDIGLPRANLPLALLSFNCGVEAGQIAFIAVVLALAYPVRRGWVRVPKGAELLPAYATGSLAVFWFLQRLPLR